jgi:PAS domain S-box-containing protein
MIRRLKSLLFSWGLGLLTLLVLLANIPQTDTLDETAWLFFAGLVAVMLNLGTMLDEDVASPASTAALMAYLTLGHDQSAALWCITAGALVGSVIWLLRTMRHRRRDYGRVLHNITMSVARMVLGVAISGWAYRQFDGPLPLDHLNGSDILPLCVLVIVYLAAYAGIQFLEAYVLRRRPPRKVIQSWQDEVGLVLLPLPFAVVGAVAYHQLSDLAFFILIAGLLTVATGVNLISRTQARYQQQVLELSALSVVSQAMRTSLDLNALLDVVYEQVALLLNARNFSVTLFDANRSTLYFPLNIRDGRPDPLDPREAGNGLLEYVIHEKTALLLADQVPRRAGLLGLTPPMMPVYSWLGVPLLAADRVLGCMVVHSSTSGQHFTRKDLNLLSTVAAQAGIAIDNAQLYGQSRDRSVQLATLNNVATILSGTLDVQQILDLVGSSAVAIASCNAVALYMWWDDTHRSLTLARHTGLSAAFAAAAPRPLFMDVDDLQRRRQPIIVTDSHIDQRARDLRHVMDREYKRAWAEFLLRKGDDLTGILIFYYNDPHYFDAEEIELLRNFTNQAALAISNARLYTQTDAALARRIEQLSALADISRELTSTLNLPGLFKLVLERAIEATQSRTGALWLCAEDSQRAASLVASRGFAPDAVERLSLTDGPVAQTYYTGQPTLVADLWPVGDGAPLEGTIRAQLNVAVRRGDEVLGVIALGSDRANEYTPDDLSFVTQLATQARIAIDNARLFRHIEEARDRLQVILDSMREGVILISAEGFIALANPRVEQLLGLEPQRIIGVPMTTLIEQMPLAERLGFGHDALITLSRSLAGGWWEETSRDGGGRVTFQLPAPKRRFIDRTSTPVRDDTGHVIGLLMVFTDVTEERELAQAREDLGNMIVHDLRGPLTAITTSLKLLSEIAPADDPVGKMVKQTTDISSRAVRKLLSLVDSLLDISKLESGVMALECDQGEIKPLCTAVIDELSPLARELDVTVELTIPDDLPLLYIDTEKVERILLNLVDNAIKFTPSGGKVKIAAYPPGTMGAEADFVRVEVDDTGPGIPDQHKERLFDRFTQLSGPRGRRRGTGLGLAFCRLAVEAHGGQIWVEDQPQGGAVFAFTLPVAQLD